MRILITGSRTWVDTGLMASCLQATVKRLTEKGYDPEVTIVSGHCPDGADKQAEDYARSQNWEVEEHPAKWTKPDGTRDRGAGFARNQAMVDLGADACVAFILDGSKGATHCARRAQVAGIPVWRVERSSKGC